MSACVCSAAGARWLKVCEHVSVSFFFFVVWRESFLSASFVPCNKGDAAAPNCERSLQLIGAGVTAACVSMVTGCRMLAEVWRCVVASTSCSSATFWLCTAHSLNEWHWVMVWFVYCFYFVNSWDIHSSCFTASVSIVSPLRFFWCCEHFERLGYWEIRFKSQCDFSPE